MLVTVLQRLIGAITVLVFVSVFVFLVIHLAPGDAAEIVAGDRASEEQLAAVREDLGLDDPLIVQFGRWAGGVLRGDLGDSLVSGRPVVDSLMSAAPATLSITALAVAMSVVFGVTAGTLAGLKRGTVVDRVVTVVTSVALAMPSFWVGMLLVGAFALERSWFPATGYAPLSDGVGEWLQHIILPAVALATATIAEVARQTRGGVVDVMARPYIRTARSKGVSGAALVRRHVLRNSAIPVVTVLGLQVGRLLGGVVVVEAVFGIPGLGTVGISAVQRRDLPLLQGYILLVATVVVVINTVVDLSYMWINPRTRTERA